VISTRRSTSGRRYIFYFEETQMTQQKLNELVAHATGEDLEEIQRRGFSIADPAEANFDPEPYDLKPGDIQKNLAMRKRRRYFAKP
jgi:hypothetical protein